MHLRLHITHSQIPQISHRFRCSTLCIRHHLLGFPQNSLLLSLNGEPMIGSHSISRQQPSVKRQEGGTDSMPDIGRIGSVRFQLVDLHHLILLLLPVKVELLYLSCKG